MLVKIIKITLLVIWMGLIFSFSMDSGIQSSKKSDGMITWFSEIILRGRVSDEEKEMYIEKYTTYVRKTAHFFLYFVLALLFFLVLEEYYPITWKSILCTILFVFCYACSDEIHQLFVSERSGKIFDVLIDTLGGILSSIGYYFIRRRKNEKETTL